MALSDLGELVDKVPRAVPQVKGELRQYLNALYSFLEAPRVFIESVNHQQRRESTGELRAIGSLTKDEYDNNQFRKNFLIAVRNAVNTLVKVLKKGNNHAAVAIEPIESEMNDILLSYDSQSRQEKIETVNFFEEKIIQVLQALS